ncbi:unnamed protein product [Cuscuta campestris]|uniref:Enhancer of polycomb-like protein n=1 Tax=Cuscuta campestris TaxID=132261 RepID=A0A484LNK4_9ASTE|nr:unnamed protein product [Cuscuta campestris]
MSRLSIRPRPLDFNKKLPIVKSFKDFDDDIELPSNTRNQILRLAAEAAENEVHQVSVKKLVSEIPTPESVIVDTYERDYLPNFAQPTSYIHARGARAELGEFVEYDLDNEDEDWLQEFNKERKPLPAETLEMILFKLEVLDHKTRERAGVINPTFASPIPVLLSFDAAVEALQSVSTTYGVFQSIYSYWKEKRERWLKPVLRRLQPPPSVNDTNPYNVFRPREKAHRLHTRRMQRRENNVQSFEKLRQVRRNLEQAKSILDTLVKREEKKRDLMESEISLQRLQMQHKNDTELLKDIFTLHGFHSFPSMAGSSEDEFVDSDDADICHPYNQPSVAVHNLPSMDPKVRFASTGSMRRKFKHRQAPTGWLHNLVQGEPVLLFTKPLDPECLAAAGITTPPPPLTSLSTPTASSSTPSSNFRGRIGRGGRLVFDRWNPLMHAPIECGDTLYVAPKPRQVSHF